MPRRCERAQALRCESRLPCEKSDGLVWLSPPRGLRERRTGRDRDQCPRVVPTRHVVQRRSSEPNVCAEPSAVLSKKTRSSCCGVHSFDFDPVASRTVRRTTCRRPASARSIRAALGGTSRPMRRRTSTPTSTRRSDGRSRGRAAGSSASSTQRSLGSGAPGGDTDRGSGGPALPSTCVGTLRWTMREPPIRASLCRLVTDRRRPALSPRNGVTGQ